MNLKERKWVAGMRRDSMRDSEMAFADADAARSVPRLAFERSRRLQL